LGYAWNRALIYAKGGAAWGHFKYENPCPGICFGAPENWYSSAKTRSGWTAGGGIEYQWNNRWSVNLEYDYLDFGTSTAFFVSTLSPAADFNENIRNRVQMVTVGANYRFGGSP
jgi:outer membrane immunogenic protein